MVSNCNSERLFLSLKRIKNEQRTSIGQEHHYHLSLFSIEHELLCQLNVKLSLLNLLQKKLADVQFEFALSSQLHSHIYI